MIASFEALHTVIGCNMHCSELFDVSACEALSAPLCRVPASARAVQSRLEVILQLMGQILSVVQLQQSTVLPLLRVACQTLTVDGLDLLQIKAAGDGHFPH